MKRETIIGNVPKISELLIGHQDQMIKYLNSYNFRIQKNKHEK